MFCIAVFNMSKYNLVELYEAKYDELWIGDHGEAIINYSETSYTSDIIYEIADDIAQYCDTDDYICPTYSERIEGIINEYGWDGVGRSLSGAAQMLVVEEIKDELYANIEDIVKYWALNELSYDHVLLPRLNGLNESQIYKYIDKILEEVDNMDWESMTLDFMDDIDVLEIVSAA